MVFSLLLEPRPPPAPAHSRAPPRHASAIFEQRQHRVLDMRIDALMDAVILQSANHLQASAITDVGQTRIFVPAEIPLENAAILRSVEHCSPRFEVANPVWGFPGVQFSHAP